MGIFTSLCPECLMEIIWFLSPPQNYICECGREVSSEEITCSHYNQIYQGGNPGQLSYLATLSNHQLLELYRSSKFGGYVRSPREQDDRYFKSYILQIAIEIRVWTVRDIQDVVNTEIYYFSSSTIKEFLRGEGPWTGTQIRERFLEDLDEEDLLFKDFKRLVKDIFGF